MTDMLPGFQPDWISSKPFPERFHTWRLSKLPVKAKVTGNHSKRQRCHHSIVITFCKQHSSS